MAMEFAVDFDFGFSPAELEVCQILLDLPHLIAKSESSCFESLISWGRKRKRSALNSPSPSPPPMPLPDSAAAPENEGPVVKKDNVSSPDTPLAFPPSESDENAKQSKKKVAGGKKKSEWLNTIDELTKNKHLLKGELENVKRYYDKLKAFNLELKARKQEMIMSLNKEKTSSSQTMETIKTPTLENQHLYYYPFMNDEPKTEPNQNIENPNGKVLISCEKSEQIEIPDLNLSLEELSHKNYSRIIAAQARQRRIQICKTKNSHSSSKLHASNPCR